MIAFVYRNWLGRERGIDAFRDRPDIKHLAIGCGTMGNRFHLIVLLDDPHKAESEVEAARNVDWYNTALLTRLAPNGKIIDAWEGAA